MIIAVKCNYSLTLKNKNMAEELINFDLPVDRSSIIKVVGIGGGGNNAVNYMFRQGIKDVNFVVCNTDAQALENSPVGVKIQLGASLTEGRGAGNKPEVGRQAAIENIDDVLDVLTQNTKMVFITAGMGGGTGTGAAPVIAKAAKEKGILTVAIVTLPFRFEGNQRINQAILGINELKSNVDSLLIVDNEKLREMYGNLPLSHAFGMADNILTMAAKGIAEIITVHGYLNVDFADVQTVMSNSGVAIMGTGVSEGEERAIHAIRQALTSPLLNNNDITGAKSVLLNISSGEEEIRMDEVGIITDYVTQSISRDALVIWGTGFDVNLGNKISVTIVATGFDANNIPELEVAQKKDIAAPERIPLFESKITDTISDSDLRVRDKSTLNNDETLQRTIIFDVMNTAGTITPEAVNKPVSDFEVKVNSQKAAERVQSIKKNISRIKETGYTTIDEKTNIEELETIPAYIRRNMQLENKPKEDISLSKISISTNSDNTIRLKETNSYFENPAD
jgi:cell division protein FtsZ